MQDDGPAWHAPLRSDLRRGLIAVLTTAAGLATIGFAPTWAGLLVIAAAIIAALAVYLLLS